MSKRFELSFKNKILKMILLIVVSTLFVQICLRLFTDLPRIIPAVIPLISLLVFFIWLYFYKQKKKKGVIN